ncbi:flagellar FliJ family protein [Myxococcota bacterium]|nr:flagellar FliJ family protein [Myxococcota bacterium]MCZ7617338.1 flagellar FliJ family protein [Myxococcota bacterium]
MKGFRFRLDPLLSVRVFELRRLVAALESARRAYAEHGRRADGVQRARERHAAQTAERLREGVAAGALYELARVEQAWCAEGIELAARDEALRAAVETAVGEVRAAQDRVESLERLRERKVQHWRREAERRAQSEIDERAQRVRRRPGLLR